MATTNILYHLKVIDDATKHFDRVKKSIDKVNNVADKLTSIGAKAGIALTGLGYVVLKFETQMNALSAVSGETTKSLQPLRERIQSLGATTQFSATQVAEASVKLMQMGYNTNQVANLLGDTLKLASAGNLSIAEASALVGTSMKSMGLELDQTTRIVDVYAKAAASGYATVNDFQELISKSGSIAKVTGVNFEDLVASFIAVKDTGVEASIAARGIGAVITRLIKPTGASSKVLESMGINVEKFVKLPFQEKIQALAKANLTAAGATEIFGLEHLKTGLALVESIKQTEKLTETLKNSNGYAKTAMDAYMNGLPGAFKLFTSAVEGAILKTGDAGLTGALVRLLNVGTSVLTWFTNLNPAILNIISTSLVLGATMLGVGIALRTVAFAVAGYRIGLIALRGTIIAIRTVSIAWAVVNGILTASFAAMGVAISPILLTIIAVVVALAGLYFAYKKIKGLFSKEKEGEDDFSLKQIKELQANITNTSVMKGGATVDVNLNNNSDAKAEVNNVSSYGNLNLGVQQ